jgi:hypothetical protein
MRLRKANMQYWLGCANKPLLMQYWLGYGNKRLLSIQHRKQLNSFMDDIRWWLQAQAAEVIMPPDIVQVAHRSCCFTTPLDGLQKSLQNNR